mgnify:CR=1 FL=1
MTRKKTNLGSDSKLNQIMCTTSNGLVKIFYDTTLSKQGALLFAQREERHKKANDFFINIYVHI